ncbi:MAG: DUF1631 family protein, partial [Oleiphilaceae bacterium]|nr:DUF1631 family protein [Oleiphilaceae bacterium]
MASEHSQKPPTAQGGIDDIIAGIRVPELPYPVGRIEASERPDWRPFLLSCWQEQCDEAVIQCMKSMSVTWTVPQVNAAYLSDRIMDVFLRTSGLHPLLVKRIARLRFLVAWRLEEKGAEAFDDGIRDWLDSLVDLRGWSDSGGRSARGVLEQFEAMVTVVAESFTSQSMQPFIQFAGQWHDKAHQRKKRSAQLHERLLLTEQGAARQRRAEQASRAAVGRALQGRTLPPAVINFIKDVWLPLLRHIAWQTGLDNDNWRHAKKLLEWLVWVGDPALSRKDRNRLYQVGEKLSDHLDGIYARVQGKPLPEETLRSVESILVARLRGEEPAVVETISEDQPFVFDRHWLMSDTADPESVARCRGYWFVAGEGDNEQRRYFLDLLTDSAEVLWTNGFGVKLGVEPWPETRAAIERGDLRGLSEPNPFGALLSDTLQALAKVLKSQRRLRARAAAQAKAKAEALRQEQVAYERARQQEEAERAEAAEKQRTEAEARRIKTANDERQALEQANWAEAEGLVNRVEPGGWIALERADVSRLKLAVRINASKKLIFVDRLGLNRTEFRIDDLIALVARGEARVLQKKQAFDDTLSQVVGGIR